MDGVLDRRGARAARDGASAHSNGRPPPPPRLRLPCRRCSSKRNGGNCARPADAGPDFVPEGGVTAAAVTNPALELKLYDPDAASIPGYLANPPPRSVARDWGGPSCIQLAGYNQNPPPERVAAGQPTDPPNLWTGVCQTAVAATLRDRARYVDLTGLARIRWVTRTSGFHVVRPVVKLADGNWFVGDYGEGAPSANSTLFLESEFALASVRWLPLDISRVVTDGPGVGVARFEPRRRGRVRGPAAGQRPRLGRLRERRAHRGLRQARRAMTRRRGSSSGG